ncbi:glycosyltransferase family 2 protein [candidate division KSB1 bacterium]
MNTQETTAVSISVVIPFFNEEESLKPLCDVLLEQLNKLDRPYEIIFVDDGSTDRSAEVLLNVRESADNIKLIQFQTNYGKSAALSVGFEHAQGQYIITMDADLQDDPREIPRLLDKLEEGYDIVSGWKKERNDPWSKRIPSKIFNYVTSLVSGLKLHDHNCGLKVYRREVTRSVSIYGELHRYIPALAYYHGFKSAEIPVKHHPRRFGKTKYGLWRFFSGFFDLLTVILLTRFTRSPLHLFGIAGMVFFVAGFCINAYLTYIKYAHNVGIGNRPLLFLGVLLIIIGFQFFSLGFLGELIANIKQQNRNYLIKNIHE